MNYRLIFFNIGNLLKMEAALLVLPLIVSFIYMENTWYAFVIPMAIMLILGVLLTIKKPLKKTMFSREGFFLVGLAWVILSLLGSLPFVISKQIPNFIDAFFETVSGFTTTGATVVGSFIDFDNLTPSILFWRSATHWVGGMGILVFILAIMPTSEGQNIYLLKAESTGPQVGKLVSKVKVTARILYIIYIALTIIEIIFLVCGKMPLFDAIVTSFGTAGTGGYGIKADSMGSYNSYCQIVIGVFMMIFGINFNIYYLLLIGKIKQALKSEEMWCYIGLIIISTISITINLIISSNYLFGEALKHSFFQVSSIITTTGYATCDFDLWPSFSKTILFILMFVGASAGSTGGGIKVSRVVILLKSCSREIKKIIHPNSVSNIRFEGQTVNEEIVKGVTNYFAIIMLVFFISVVIVSFDGFDLETNITAVTACLNNVGPGFGKVVGATGNYYDFNVVSKIVLIFCMLAGRLELYPMLTLFNPKAWSNKK